MTLWAALSGCLVRAVDALAPPQVGASLANITLPAGAPFVWNLPEDAFVHPETMTFTVTSQFNSSVTPVAEFSSFGPSGTEENVVDSVAIGATAFFCDADDVVRSYDRLPPHPRLQSCDADPCDIGSGSREVVLDGERLFVAADDRVYALNGSQPDAMTRIDSLPYSHDKAIVYDAARGILFAGGSPGLNAISVAPDGTLSSVGTTSLTGIPRDGSDAMAMMDPTSLLVCRDVGVSLVDVTVPGSFSVITTFGPDAVGVASRDDVVYVVKQSAPASLSAWSLANRTAPALLDTLTFSGTSYGGRLSGGMMFAMSDSHVHLVDVSNASQLQSIVAVPVSLPRHVAVSGQTATVAASKASARVWKLFEAQINDTAPGTPGDYPVTVSACVGAGNCVEQTFYVKVPAGNGTTGVGTTAPATSGGTTGIGSTGSSGTTAQGTTGARATQPSPSVSGSGSGEAGTPIGVIIGALAGGVALLLSASGGVVAALRKRREPAGGSKEAIKGPDADDANYGSVYEVGEPKPAVYGSVADVAADSSVATPDVVYAELAEFKSPEES